MKPSSKRVDEEVSVEYEPSPQPSSSSTEAGGTGARDRSAAFLRPAFGPANNVPSYTTGGHSFEDVYRQTVQVRKNLSPLFRFFVLFP
jgi:hypothetical protein